MGEIRKEEALPAQNGFSKAPPKPRRYAKEVFEEPPLFRAVMTYISYGLLTLIGHVVDFLRRIGVVKDTDALRKDVSGALYIVWSTRP